MEDKRFIEETFPVKEVSEESSKEKNIRHGHISTLHIWWARRPLASSRATNYTALIHAPQSTDEWEKKRQFIAKLSQWDNSLNIPMLEKARKELLETNGNGPPRVLDPFAGGGAIPLEAQRLGCETYANDYNPVAALILKCTLEFPQKYKNSSNRTEYGLEYQKERGHLLLDIDKWSRWVLDRARQELERFYPNDKNGSVPVGYIWARTIPCQNPACGAEIPLMRQYWLVYSQNRKVSVYPFKSDRKVEFRIVGPGYDKFPKGFDPEKGSVSRAVATCLVCGSVVDDETTRKLFGTKQSRERMITVVTHEYGTKGKTYRIARENDIKAFKSAQEYLSQKRKTLLEKWGIDPVPDESTPEGKGRGAERAFSVRNYNMNTWGDLFNARQKLSLVVYVENVRAAYEEMLREGYELAYANAVISYLALTIDRLASYNSSLCRWESAGGFIAQTFARPTLPILWDYFELCPWSESTGDWNSAMDWISRVVEHCSSFPASPATVTQSSATSLHYPDNYFDAVFTDPPYYDNVPYSYLSDFFYVWLKRTLGQVFPEIFATPLTPKADEIVAYSNIEGGFDAGKKFFEDKLKKSFIEVNRVLRPNGIAIIVYAHKSTAGWETLVNSLLDSGLVITAAWPINTERTARPRAKESAALASSIYMVARKVKKQPTGFYSEVRQELKEYLNRKLDKIWREGIYGADFFISAIGSAIEVFGKYERVIDDEGSAIRADKLLEDVRRIVTDYAVKQVLHNGFASEITPMTRLYVLWRWAYGEAIVEYDDARKLGQGVGIDITQEWNKGFVHKDKEFIKVLGPEDRDLDELKSSTELIDVLQRVLLLWKRGRSDEVTEVLRESAFGKSDVFYRVAQAISESLPNESKEKKMLEGFLAGKERVRGEAAKEVGQTRLFE